MDLLNRLTVLSGHCLINHIGSEKHAEKVWSISFSLLFFANQHLKNYLFVLGLAEPIVIKWHFVCSTPDVIDDGIHTLSALFCYYLLPYLFPMFSPIGYQIPSSLLWGMKARYEAGLSLVPYYVVPLSCRICFTLKYILDLGALTSKQLVVYHLLVSIDKSRRRYMRVLYIIDM